MKESTETLLQSIIDQKPLETQRIFDALVTDKISDKLDDYKSQLANEKFGGEKEEEAEEELSDEEIEELLSGLSDEELEQMVQDLDAEDEGGSDEAEVELEGEPEESEIEVPEVEEEHIRASNFASLKNKLKNASNIIHKPIGGGSKDSQKNMRLSSKLSEEAEELDELSRKTLKSYLDKRHPYKSGDYKKKPHPNAVRAGDRLDNQYVSKIGEKGKPETRKYYMRDYNTRKRMTSDENVWKSKKAIKENIEELEEGGPTRKHFQMAADTIKALPEDKRKEHAEIHASMYAKQNPRFNRSKFMAACGVKD
jgi:hypothetical protein